MSCHDPDHARCSDEVCSSCRSLAIAKRILKKHPLDKAWIEEEFYEKVYQNYAYWGPHKPATSGRWSKGWGGRKH